jgi:A/G-specific adenine glycosylase
LSVDNDGFAHRVVRWQAAHGRHDLPWQQTRDPYRVWLSEVMLQQTQVVTVLDYFSRFLQRFPDVASLAAAPLDDVMGLWSGLGYYSRARNLHACACRVVEDHAGVFPRSAAVLQELPGIGRSTAAAIASICYGERVAILDGNVKRVLTRYLGFEGDLSEAAQEKQLWALAESLLPVSGAARTMPQYTQGVMDLGATLCTARAPNCPQCPLADACAARRLGKPEAYPVKTRKVKRSALSLWLLWAQTPSGAVLLQKRPASGVWAGLFAMPAFESRTALAAAVGPLQSSRLNDLEPFKHVLTHKDLHLHPVQLVAAKAALRALDGQWVSREDWPGLGLPAPVRKLLSGAEPAG